MRVNTLRLAVVFALTVSGAYAMNGGDVGGLRAALRNLEVGFTGPKNLVNTEMQLPTNLVAMSEGLLDAGDLQRLRDLIPSFNKKKELFTRKSKTDDGRAIVDLLNKAIRRAEENERNREARVAAAQNAQEERAREARVAAERNAQAERNRRAEERRRADARRAENLRAENARVAAQRAADAERVRNEQYFRDRAAGQRRAEMIVPTQSVPDLFSPGARRELSPTEIAIIREQVSFSGDSVLQDMEAEGYDITLVSPNALSLSPHNTNLPIVYRPLVELLPEGLGQPIRVQRASLPTVSRTVPAPSQPVPAPVRRVSPPPVQAPVSRTAPAPVRPGVASASVQPVECPICMDQMTTEETACCGYPICTGCRDRIVAQDRSRQGGKCPQCRHSPLETRPMRARPVETAPVPKDEDVACPLCDSTVAELRAAGVQVERTACCGKPLCTTCSASIRRNAEESRRHGGVEFEFGEGYNYQGYGPTRPLCPYCREPLVTTSASRR